MGLQNDGKSKRRFGSRVSAQQTIEKINDAAKSLGLLVERVNPCKVGIQFMDKFSRHTYYKNVQINALNEKN